jgi:Integrase core domain
MSLHVLKTPVRTPQANAHCERFIGTVRRECLDWMIPLNERHVRSVLAEWISHYNSERPHSALGPGLPDDPARQTVLTGHRLPATHRVVDSARLGGLHHHYQLELLASARAGVRGCGGCELFLTRLDGRIDGNRRTTIKGFSTQKIARRSRTQHDCQVTEVV